MTPEGLVVGQQSRKYPKFRTAFNYDQISPLAKRLTVCRYVSTAPANQYRQFTCPFSSSDAQRNGQFKKRSAFAGYAAQLGADKNWFARYAIKPRRTDPSAWLIEPDAALLK
ncbi:hypothetical protein MPL3356_300006 [Mesorhizobium plurifarium]|uniref:Uncharacterized protein n=1 Tax=Mesorhizobium plurifarium TaxID=69974 RepID=A0A090FKM8_MESPL|nr:hypothetical protein MPL3356_300006 [Mesorhizobium plurifarium]